ncbi:hypothetical protein B0H10DRAFT_2244485 [Mycena sp. CBHHK59/15]|nr:hypothetical protein B0H10DRAFT_2244485 [Mycena sp. CBHHK59/15]
MAKVAAQIIKKKAKRHELGPVPGGFQYVPTENGIYLMQGDSNGSSVGKWDDKGIEQEWMAGYMGAPNTREMGPGQRDKTLDDVMSGVVQKATDAKEAADT